MINDCDFVLCSCVCIVICVLPKQTYAYTHARTHIQPHFHCTLSRVLNDKRNTWPVRTSKGCKVSQVWICACVVFYWFVVVVFVLLLLLLCDWSHFWGGLRLQRLITHFALKADLLWPDCRVHSTRPFTHTYTPSRSYNNTLTMVKTYIIMETFAWIPTTMRQVCAEKMC